jgi:hypothetical protein
MRPVKRCPAAASIYGSINYLDKNEKTLTLKQRPGAFARRSPIDALNAANANIDLRRNSTSACLPRTMRPALRLDVDFRTVNAYVGRLLRKSRTGGSVVGHPHRWVEHPSGYWDFCDFPSKTRSGNVLSWPCLRRTITITPLSRINAGVIGILPLWWATPG